MSSASQLMDQSLVDQPPVDLTHVPYAAAPGSGPANETCATCKHRWLQRYKYGAVNKCKVLIDHWTFDRRTDIKVRTAACIKWEIKS